MNRNKSNSNTNESQLDLAIDQYGKTAGRAGRPGAVAKSLTGFSAAAAAGLFGANHAEADIVYRTDGRTVNISTLSQGNVLQGIGIDMDENGKDDFRLVGLNRGPSYYDTDAFFMHTSSNMNGGMFKASSSAGMFQTPLRVFASGSNISARTSYSQRFAFAGIGVPGFFATNIFNLQGAGSASGIVGGIFTTSAGTVGGGEERFAWMRIRLTVDAARIPLSVQLVDWAYEDSGAGIVAGVPEPGSGLAVLALLAVGAAGIRRRRKSVEQN